MQLQVYYNLIAQKSNLPPKENHGIHVKLHVVRMHDIFLTNLSAKKSFFNVVCITLNEESMDTNHNSITVGVGVMSCILGLFLKVKHQGTEWEYFWSLKIQMFFLGTPDIPHLLFWQPVYAGFKPMYPQPMKKLELCKLITVCMLM